MICNVEEVFNILIQFREMGGWLEFLFENSSDFLLLPRDEIHNWNGFKLHILSTVGSVRCFQHTHAIVWCYFCLVL